MHANVSTPVDMSYANACEGDGNEGREYRVPFLPFSPVVTAT
jgi:hypothetical protein